MKNKRIKSHQHWLYSKHIEQWNKFQILKIDEINNIYYSLFDKDNGLLSFLEQMWMYTKLLNEMVWDDKFDNLFKYTDYAIRIINEIKPKLNFYLIDMFNQINGINIAIKFKEFDKEIKSYKILIDQKKKEIRQNINVLSNQRRISILQDKINHLINLKNDFINTSKTRSKNDLNSFLTQVEQLVNLKQKVSNKISIFDSKANIQDKLDQFKDFINKYWPNIVLYINNCDQWLQQTINLRSK